MKKDVEERLDADAPKSKRSKMEGETVTVKEVGAVFPEIPVIPQS